MKAWQEFLSQCIERAQVTKGNNSWAEGRHFQFQKWKTFLLWYLAGTRRLSTRYLKIWFILFLLWYPESTHLVLVGYHSIIFKIITAMVFTRLVKPLGARISKLTHPFTLGGLLILGMLLPWGFTLHFQTFQRTQWHIALGLPCINRHG
jgi:hypothetical protein